VVPAIPPTVVPDRVRDAESVGNTDAVSEPDVLSITLAVDTPPPPPPPPQLPVIHGGVPVKVGHVPPVAVHTPLLSDATTTV